MSIFCGTHNERYALCVGGVGFAHLQFIVLCPGNNGYRDISAISLTPGFNWISEKAVKCII
jgi:hypothetical protein